MASVDGSQEATEPELLSRALCWERSGCELGHPDQASFVALVESGPAAFGAATMLVVSEDLDERMLGVRILKELAGVEAVSREAVLPLLEDMTRESDPLALSLVLAALGNWGAPRSLPAVLAASDSDDQRVRYSAAGAISGCVDWLEPDGLALDRLDELARDPEPDVRYSAVFELAEHAPETRVVRQCLERAAHDTDPGVRKYAIAGLTRLASHGVR